ncbi:MAG: glycoside hydrolase family 10 protein [Nostoc sp. DedVER02]|uniref:glycoside hydrolase family 10 protein n=1 Tax=unclassified Nostoc TaxID=2593658 RepID=UPI002AD5296E|nr:MULTISPECIES: glycoside hydrolase family 10 protein [unclassified Nostoc]MDZ7987960.1 glycoside hydrolase family 10 protein [Nostoc sp. DedVER02]MDZ8114884.1 glycoside hydrolase family 10 protein [Nostoc sp. DedVER01b]
MKSPFIIQTWRRILKYLFPILILISFVTVLLVDSFTPAISQGWGFGAIAQIPRQEIRGVWMTTNDFDTLKDRAKVQDAVSQLRRLNFNTIYPVVWNSGYVMYPSAIAQRAGIQPFIYKGSDGHDILADLINQAHRKGLLVIPWFEFGFMAPPTSELALNYPDWFTQKRDGSQTSISAAGEVMWLNPFLPQVQQFITNLVLETVTQYDADGIQFDDHMSLPNEFGYDQYTVALYTKETKNAPPKNSQDAAWVKWRADKITAFMVQLNQAVKQRKPQAIFSVSPNYYDFAYKFHLQDWLSWMRQNIVDELIVQVYRPNLQSFVANISRQEIQEAQKIIPTGIGIMTGLRNNPVPMQQIKSQVRAAQERGLGVTFFYYESLWNDALEPLKERQVGFGSLFPSPALRAKVE